MLQRYRCFKLFFTCSYQVFTTTDIFVLHIQLGLDYPLALLYKEAIIFAERGLKVTINLCNRFAGKKYLC